jgi:endonuclease/exonuclease/phosphatase family metal-dependent hydrolase
MAGILRKFTKGFFVTSNIVVAIVFLLGCYGSWFNPKNFWFIGFFTLASLYLLVVLLGFIVFWFFAKKKMMLISIAAILLAWKPIGQIIKFRTAGNFTMAKSAASLRIMSWNIAQFNIVNHKKHPEVKTEMLNLINEYAPDVACFQELAGGDKDSTAINYVPTISKKLNFSEYSFCYKTFNEYDSKHHFGIIIYSRYPIINRQTINPISDDYNFVFQYIDIVKATDTFRVFNIHMQSLKFSNDNLQYLQDAEKNTEIDIAKSKSILYKLKIGFVKRQIQSENIKSEMNKSPYPVILCGDFNDVPNSYAYCTIGENLKNVYTEKGSGIGRTFSGISPTLRIDNIFVDEKFDVEQYTRIPKKLSDHFPILADVKMGSGE